MAQKLGRLPGANKEKIFLSKETELLAQLVKAWERAIRRWGALKGW